MKYTYQAVVEADTEEEAFEWLTTDPDFYLKKVKEEQ